MASSAAVLVRDVRMRRGMTQRQLAIRAATTQSAISRIERGAESPTIERLEQILLAMGVHLELQTATMNAWADPAEVATFATLTPTERLRHGIAASHSASKMHQAGVRRRLNEDVSG